MRRWAWKMAIVTMLISILITVGLMGGTMFLATYVNDYVALAYLCGTVIVGMVLLFAYAGRER